MASALIVCDFDGTLARKDVGNVVIDHFAPAEWSEINSRFHAGELSLPEAQRRMWRLARGSLAEMTAHALAHGALRGGAPELLAAAADGRVELVLASGGFGFYIEAILAGSLEHLSARYHNELKDTAQGGVVPHFPHDDLSCPRCAVCKARVIERHRRAGQPVYFCGDGGSDCCAAHVADEVFSVRGKRLSSYCAQEGLNHTDFDDFQAVLDACLGD